MTWGGIAVATALLAWLLGARRGLRGVVRAGVGGRVEVRGVVVRHPGVVLDQERAVTAIERAVELLLRRGHREGTLATLLRRVEVRVLPPRLGGAPAVDVRAAWAGGWRDRGLIALRYGDGWSDALGRALLALLLVELEPGTRPEDVRDVGEEAADA